MSSYLSTVVLLGCSNLFMTFAWYGHLKNLNDRPWIFAALVSWGIALFEYLLQVPANRIGHQVMSVGQLKILQEVITLSIFVPFSYLYLREKLTLDYLWAGLCLLAAAYFMFRQRGPRRSHSMSTLNALLDRLIDYAGLFPPAELAMVPAVENYQTYLRGPYRWMLGRFIVPARRLREFEAVLRELQFQSSDERPWLVSALIASASQTEQFQADMNEIDEFNARQRGPAKPSAVVDTVEGKAEDDVDIAAPAEHFTSEFALFLELPIDNRLNKLLREFEKARSVREVFAKVRTGGIVPEAIPPADRVAAFIAGCFADKVGFKATAGLHHPIRARYPLTYRESPPCAVMYGFLNVFVAACAAYDDHRNIARIEEILLETELDQFRFGGDSIGWRGEAWTMDLVRRAREFAISFGSCSFAEPVDDLRKLKLLPECID